MKLKQIADILDDCTECDIYEDSDDIAIFTKPLFTNLIGEEIHGKRVDGIRIENCPVVGMWVGLPEEDVRVIVAVHYDNSYTQIDTDRILHGQWVRWEGSITHWTELPELPNESEDTE